MEDAQGRRARRSVSYAEMLDDGLDEDLSDFKCSSKKRHDSTRDRVNGEVRKDDRKREREKHTEHEKHRDKDRHRRDRDKHHERHSKERGDKRDEKKEHEKDRRHKSERREDRHKRDQGKSETSRNSQASSASPIPSDPTAMVSPSRRNTKPRLSLDEKRFQRELEVALEMSKVESVSGSPSSQRDKENTQEEGRASDTKEMVPEPRVQLPEEYKNGMLLTPPKQSTKEHRSVILHSPPSQSTKEHGSGTPNSSPSQSTTEHRRGVLHHPPNQSTKEHKRETPNSPPSQSTKEHSNRTLHSSPSQNTSATDDISPGTHNVTGADGDLAKREVLESVGLKEKGASKARQTMKATGIFEPMPSTSSGRRTRKKVVFKEDTDSSDSFDGLGFGGKSDSDDSEGSDYMLSPKKKKKKKSKDIKASKTSRSSTKTPNKGKTSNKALSSPKVPSVSSKENSAPQITPTATSLAERDPAVPDGAPIVRTSSVSSTAPPFKASIAPSTKTPITSVTKTSITPSAKTNGVLPTKTPTKDNSKAVKRSMVSSPSSPGTTMRLVKTPFRSPLATSPVTGNPEAPPRTSLIPFKGTGLRLGLSRRVSIKPLHPGVAAKISD